MARARRIVLAGLVAAGCAAAEPPPLALPVAPPGTVAIVARALASITLRAGMSIGGLVYFPLGDYADVEVVLVGEDEVLRMLVPVAPPSAES